MAKHTVPTDRESIVDATKRVANAIAVQDAIPGQDVTGGKVECLTEAVMSVTAGLCRIAEAVVEHANAVDALERLDNIADAIRLHAESIDGLGEVLNEFLKRQSRKE